MSQDYDPDSLEIDRHERVYMPYSGLDFRPAGDRVHDFNEIVVRFDEQRVRFEAARCIHCPDPEPCKLACPAHNNIPAALWQAEMGDFCAAAEVFRRTSSMPEICGRICPQEHLCEGACVHNARGEPVLIGAIEAWVSDYQRTQAEQCGLSIARGAPSGKRVAVAGGGPAGLACAERLVNFGHAVTVFDARPLPGGLLLYGIPGFKLSSQVFFAKLRELHAAGVSFINNVAIGRERSIAGLFAEGFDAVFIGIGAGADVRMGVPGEDLPGVYQGIEFLIQHNVEPANLPPGMLQPADVGERVVVIGGGDTASDCIRTAVRLGAREVTCVYRRSEKEIPAAHKDRKLAHEEGATHRYLTQPVRFLAGADGRLAGVECVQMELGAPDERGRRQPVPVEGSNFVLPADSAILALGFNPHPELGASTPGLVTRRGGLLEADPRSGATSLPGVFAGGDCVSGPALVIQAVAAGRRAAESIHKVLEGG